MKHRITEELNGVMAFVAAIWCVFLIDCIAPGEFNHYGLAPRHTSGLFGIVAMPFLHANWQHLFGNTVSLTVLLCLLAGSRTSTYRVVPQIIVLSGALLWLFGRSDCIHVGASGLIYGLIAFLIVAGFREARPVALAIAIFVGITYGLTLVKGILPITAGEGVSWDGHLMGAFAGTIIARNAVAPRAADSSKAA